MNFLDLAKERYSCRSFAEKEVEMEKIEKILEAARVAPTAVNYQPQRILILNDKEKLKIEGKFIKKLPPKPAIKTKKKE